MQGERRYWNGRSAAAAAARARSHCISRVQLCNRHRAACSFSDCGNGSAASAIGRRRPPLKAVTPRAARSRRPGPVHAATGRYGCGFPASGRTASGIRPGGPMAAAGGDLSDDDDERVISGQRSTRRRRRRSSRHPSRNRLCSRVSPSTSTKQSLTAR